MFSNLTNMVKQTVPIMDAINPDKVPEWLEESLDQK
jgi:hypothetical protein